MKNILQNKISYLSILIQDWFHGKQLPDMITNLLLIGLTTSLFLNLRHVFYAPNNFYTGAYSDFTSFSLYLSDLFIFSFILTFLPRWKEINKKYWLITISFFILLTGNILLNLGNYLPLQVYFSVKIIEFPLLYVFFRQFISLAKLERLFIPIFISFLSFEAILALVQFTIQQSVGLHILGESLLSPALYGVAKIVAHGTTYIRGYGTFPHPNLLSAFFTIGLLVNLYLLTKTEQKTTWYFYAGSLILLSFGLLITFSRAAFIAFAIACIFLTVYKFIERHINKQFLYSIVLLGISLITAGFIFGDFLLIRATFSDSATRERVFYNKTGLDIIKSEFPRGIGLGTSVLHMEQFSNQRLQPWEKQPIHNFYLLTIAEWGLTGLVLLAFLAWHIWRLALIVRKGASTFPLYILASWIAILVLMLFDHYFYTIQQTQLLFWLLLAITASIMRQTDVPHETQNHSI